MPFPFGEDFFNYALSRAGDTLQELLRGHASRLDAWQPDTISSPSPLAQLGSPAYARTQDPFAATMRPLANGILPSKPMPTPVPGQTPGHADAASPVVAPAPTPASQVAVVPAAAANAPTLADSSSQRAFVDSLLPTALAYQESTGIPAAAFIAVAAHESNWGKAGGNMLFGIKGPGMTAPTWEVYNGQPTNITDSFRTYPDVASAFKDFIALVSQGRYASAWHNLQSSGNWQQFFRDINAAGYATDPIWGNKIVHFTEGMLAPMLEAR